MKLKKSVLVLLTLVISAYTTSDIKNINVADSTRSQYSTYDSMSPKKTHTVGDKKEGNLTSVETKQRKYLIM